MTFTKTLIITILYVTVLFTAKAQTAVEDNVISFSLPKGSQKLSAAAFNDQLKRTFKRPAKAISGGTSISYNNLFIIVKEKEVDLKNAKTLEQWKKGLEVVYNNLGTPYISKIIERNNRHYYILEDRYHNEYQIYFCSEDVNNKYFTGYIIFKEEHKKEAYDYLDNLLKCLKFEVL